MPKATASLRFAFESAKQMHAIADGLKPEASHPSGRKSHSAILTRGRWLTLRFEANDSATLRAIMSSYLRLFAASFNATTAVHQLEKSTYKTMRDKD